MRDAQYEASAPHRLIQALKPIRHYVRQEFKPTDPRRAVSWQFFTPDGRWLASILWSQTGPTQVACTPEVKALL